MSLILKEAAKMLIKKGYRVIGWEDNSLLPKEREGDFVSICFGKDNIRNIGTTFVLHSLGKVTFGLKHRPKGIYGDSVMCFNRELGKIKMEDIKYLFSIYHSLQRFKGDVERYGSFDEFAKRELEIYDFKHEVTLDELVDIK